MEVRFMPGQSVADVSVGTPAPQRFDTIKFLGRTKTGRRLSSVAICHMLAFYTDMTTTGALGAIRAADRGESTDTKISQNAKYSNYGITMEGPKDLVKYIFYDLIYRPVNTSGGGVVVGSVVKITGAANLVAENKTAVTKYAKDAFGVGLSEALKIVNAAIAGTAATYTIAGGDYEVKIGSVTIHGLADFGLLFDYEIVG